MDLQWYSRKGFVFIKLRIGFKSEVQILEATRIWLKSQDAVEPTFCSWNLSCLFLLFSFSCSFSLGKCRNTRLTSGKTHKHVQGCSSTYLTDVCGEVKQSYGLNRGLAETVRLRQSVYVVAPFPKAALDCVLPRYPLHSSLSQTIKLRFDLIGATITPISRSTTKKYNVKVFAKKLLCSQSQSRVVLNGAWCAANKLATFWPSPGPVLCSAEPQPWSLRTSPHLAPRRRWRRDMGPTVLSVWRLRMALPSRLLFHAAFSPCWRALCDVIISRRTVLCDVNK